MGFTDRDWSDTRRRRHVTPPVGVGGITAGSMPVDPSMGDLWFDTVSSTTYVWNGSRWDQVLAPPPGPGVFPRPDPTMPDGSMVLVVDGVLSAIAAVEPDQLRAYRDQMMVTAERWATAHGYGIARGSWATRPTVAGFDELIRLECYLSPITDGVWGEIHTARAQDAADRAVARSGPPSPADGPIVVHVPTDGP